jgi:hypothetical protein
MTDFFAEPPAKHTFTPTRDEIAFLESKLMFLDPKQTKFVSTKDAMDFVRHTGLPLK